jgi:hypothetical protein
MIIIQLQFHSVEVELKNSFAKSLKKIDRFSSISVMEGISGLILSTTMSHCVFSARNMKVDVACVE